MEENLEVYNEDEMFDDSSYGENLSENSYVEEEEESDAWGDVWEDSEEFFENQDID